MVGKNWLLQQYQYEEEVDIEQEQTEDKADNNSQRDGDVPTINNNLKEAEQQQHLKSI